VAQASKQKQKSKKNPKKSKRHGKKWTSNACTVFSILHIFTVKLGRLLNPNPLLWTESMQCFLEKKVHFWSLNFSGSSLLVLELLFGSKQPLNSKNGLFDWKKKH
jgi:hypothetical protein